MMNQHISYQVRVKAPHRTNSGPGLDVVIATTATHEKAEWISDAASEQVAQSLGPIKRPLKVAGIVVDAFSTTIDDWTFTIERVDTTPRIEVVE